MKTRKAVITVAGESQRNLPLQTLIDTDSQEKSVLRIVVDEALRSGIKEVCIVVKPGDEDAYKKVVGDLGSNLHFIHQKESLGYGHAVFCAKSFVGNDPFLHMVGDHLYVNRSKKSCSQQLLEVAEVTGCSTSAVQAINESLLTSYGVVGGIREHGKENIYQIQTVLEKPTPTLAEQELIVSGLRSGHYLGFFGMHVLSPAIMEILENELSSSEFKEPITLSDSLAKLAQQEKYMAFEINDWRYDVGIKYGLLNAQLALALNGEDSDEVLSGLLSILATRELDKKRS
jgi:UTP--glucose-1-phosphate uridylyltransferase